MKTVPDFYYAVIFKERSSKTFGVRFPNFPNIITYGKNFTHAVEMAHEALSAALESDFDRQQPLPSPRKARIKKHQGKIVPIFLEATVKMAYLLRTWRENASLNQKQLAERLGISFQAYQRMERPGRSNLTVSTLQRIAHALHQTLVLTFPGQSDKKAA